MMRANVLVAAAFVAVVFFSCNGFLGSIALRKLSKNSKASQDGGALCKDARSLVRTLVFEKAVAVFRFTQQPELGSQPSYPEGRRAENNGRALQGGNTNPCGGSCGALIEYFAKEFGKEECVKCLNFLKTLNN